MDFRLAILLCGAAILIGGCAPAPTPFPVTPIASQASTTPTVGASVSSLIPTLPEIRYGVLPNAGDDIPQSLMAFEQLTIEVLDASSDQSNYDVLVGYGIYDGWTVSDPQPPPIITRFRTDMPPLDSAELRRLVLDAMNIPLAVAQLDIPGVQLLHNEASVANNSREQLALLGYPDGIQVYGVVEEFPGKGMILKNLSAAGIQLITLPPTVGIGQPLTIGQLTNTAAGENAVDAPLYSIPISYRVAPDILTTISDNGWPIVSR